MTDEDKLIAMMAAQLFASMRGDARAGTSNEAVGANCVHMARRLLNDVKASATPTEPIKICIVVRGGVVQAVRAADAYTPEQLKVALADFDNLEDDLRLAEVIDDTIDVTMPHSITLTDLSD